jgi:hypothetical protein
VSILTGSLLPIYSLPSGSRPIVPVIHVVE